MYNYYFNIYINNKLVFNKLTTLQTLLQLNLLGSEINIELLNKYSLVRLENYNTVIEIKKL